MRTLLFLLSLVADPPPAQGGGQILPDIESWTWTALGPIRLLDLVSKEPIPFGLVTFADGLQARSDERGWLHPPSEVLRPRDSGFMGATADCDGLSVPVAYVMELPCTCLVEDYLGAHWKSGLEIRIGHPSVRPLGSPDAADVTILGREDPATGDAVTSQQSITIPLGSSKTVFLPCGGKATVEIRAAGLVSSTHDVSICRGSVAHLAVTPRPAPFAQGRVLDPDGHPVADALVVLTPLPFSPDSGGARELQLPPQAGEPTPSGADAALEPGVTRIRTLTESDGRWCARPQTASVLEVRCFAHGFRQGVFMLQEVEYDGLLEGVDLRLLWTSTPEPLLQIVDREDLPLCGLQFLITEIASSGTFPFPGLFTTRTDGSVRAEWLREGFEYLLLPRHEDKPHPELQGTRFRYGPGIPVRVLPRQ